MGGVKFALAGSRERESGDIGRGVRRVAVVKKSQEFHHIVLAKIKGGSSTESRTCPRPTVALKAVQTQTRPIVFSAAPPLRTKEVRASPGKRQPRKAKGSGKAKKVP